MVIRAFNKPGQLRLHGSMDYLIDFMETNNLLLSSFCDIQENSLDQSLGAFFIKNSVQIMSYEEALEKQKRYENYCIKYNDSDTQGKSGMFRPFIYNDKDYHLEEDCDSDALITDFPGLLRYTNHFCCCSETSLVRFGDELKAPKINYNNEKEISIKEIDERIGWNLFCDALNLKLGFYYLKTKSSLELFFLSTCKDLIAVKIINSNCSIDLFINTNIKLVDRKIVELGFNEDCEFTYTPELFKFKTKVFPVVLYCPHGYTVTSSIAQNIDYYLTSSMSNLC